MSCFLQGHPSNLHHIMTTNVQMSIIRSNAPGPPLHIGASHLPRGKNCTFCLSSQNALADTHLVRDTVIKNVSRISLLKL